MKKLILSAVFALACFTAQAKNEVIKNDDKKPKNKKEVILKAKKTLATSPMCCMSSTVTRSCGGFTFNHTGVACARTCKEAFMLATDEAVGSALSGCF